MWASMLSNVLAHPPGVLVYTPNTFRVQQLPCKNAFPVEFLYVPNCEHAAICSDIAGICSLFANAGAGP